MHTFRRCMVQNPTATLFDGSTDSISWSPSLGVFPNVDLMLETNSRWLRMWAFWSMLQPRPPDASNPDRAHNIGLSGPAGPETRGQNPEQHFNRIRQQIEFIRTHPNPQISSLRIILTAIEFPWWTNGQNWGTGLAGSRSFAFPDDLSPTSPWAEWIGWLFRNFSRQGALRVDAIEIVNEPNAQCRPQASTRGNAACWTSQMFSSALAQRAAKSRDLGMAETAMPALMGPGTADIFKPERPDLQSDYSTFTNNLISQLVAARFTAPPSFVWTHHNYNDVEYDLGIGSTAPSGAADECPPLNRASHAQGLLTYRWSGGPYGDIAAPYVFITEGGCRRKADWMMRWSLSSTNPQNSTQVDAKQGDLVGRNLARMQNEEDGKGIGMVSTYTFNAATGSPQNDSAIRNAVSGTTPGRKREPAYTRWTQAPSHPNLYD
ncbi:MAG TPA: hypothetical protein VG318_14325 [Actinomycetota bacterium]|nr:hypothetical protein [Actinomycetota bacterium]